ncbi:cyclic nucleotide-binding domain-containing protein [Enterobacteriaceae endosymbiont of Macroplea appendiculata]|uniref:cyclic nucleotide-binding domain-containing protein n=1 Tax=Enterobacteriaceae endosymbiont of Macroplea appendiculata TaxID=2675790 RepID=UPI0014493B60|nr:cyclic nucleotide-binding domain-containing protein [Enterobacteriaceae endosymbiont of Macroplea appendiculata]QJC30700.1 helix-turn-helix domain-containing protein [Enterobacteriaceae endosymbiont of Macroplea appendiculata]
MILKKIYNKKKSQLKTCNNYCSYCYVQKICIFYFFQQNKLEHYNIFTKKKIIQKGYILFQEKDPIKYIYILCSGVIKKFFITQSGTEQIMKFYFHGDLFGLDNIISGYYNSFTQSLEKSTICLIPLNIFKYIYNQIPIINNYIINFIIQETIQYQQLIFLLSKFNAEQKIATFIYNLYKKNNMSQDSIKFIKLSMNRYDIGNYLGLATETISRTFSKFKNNKIIMIRGKYIQIINYIKLIYLVNK